MALIKCEECGKEVSDKAAACVGCGSPIGPNVVKFAEEDDTADGVLRAKHAQQAWMVYRRGMIVLIVIANIIMLATFGNSTSIFAWIICLLIMGGSLFLFIKINANKETWQRNHASKAKKG